MTAAMEPERRGEDAVTSSGEAGAPLLSARGVKTYFRTGRGLLRRAGENVQAVDGVDLDVLRGETLGLVGESGCGKSTLCRTLIRLVEPTEGRIVFEGRDLPSLRRRELKAIRRDVQIIFQDPIGSLNPRHLVRDIVGEGLAIHGLARGAERDRLVREMLDRVGLRPDSAMRYPHEFSGGQRQRIAVARALATNAEFLILDEPTSFLDVSVQAQVLNLLKDLQREFGLTYLFISHNLSVIAHMSDKVGVLYLGKVMETADKETIYTKPKHPYTHALMDAIPIPDPTLQKRREILSGDVPSLLELPPGCVFHDRCQFATDKCSKDVPSLDQIAPGHFAACHYSRELQMKPLLTYKKGNLPGAQGAAGSGS